MLNDDSDNSNISENTDKNEQLITLQQIWEDLFNENKFENNNQSNENSNVSLQVFGREIIIPKISKDKTAAYFTFSQICENNLGPSDYLKIANTFQTVFIGFLSAFLFVVCLCFFLCFVFCFFFRLRTQETQLFFF